MPVVRPLSPARVLPWVLVAALGAATLFLLSRAFLPWGESRSVSAAPVVAAVRHIAQFSTVEIQVSDVVRYEEAKHFLVFDFPKSATLRLRGRVLGGFDLENRAFKVLPDADHRIVRVKLPQPRILAVDPRFEWFDEKSGWINPITRPTAPAGCSGRGANSLARRSSPGSSRKRRITPGSSSPRRPTASGGKRTLLLKEP